LREGKKGIRAVLHAFKVEGLPDSLVDLLCQMLCIDPSRRLTIQQVLEHPFLKSIVSEKKFSFSVADQDLRDTSSSDLDTPSPPSSPSSQSPPRGCLFSDQPNSPPSVSPKHIAAFEEAANYSKHLHCQKFKSRGEKGYRR